MADEPMYHDGMRQLQDARETRDLADRLEQVTLRHEFTDEDKAFIERVGRIRHAMYGAKFLDAADACRNPPFAL